MSDTLSAENTPTLTFPDWRAEAFARAEEFRRLPAEVRLRDITAMMAWGLEMVRKSPRRAAIEAAWQEQESQWQERHRKVIAEHGN